MELTLLELIKEAKILGVNVDLLEDCASENVLFSYNGKEVLFCPDGVPLNEHNLQAYYIARNKQYCKRLFRKLNISHPQSIVFKDFNNEKDKINAFWKSQTTYVCKPLDGSEGKGVCLNIQHVEQLEQVWKEWKSNYEVFILEEQVAGRDLRIQAIGGNIVAVCVREPASVEGDGLLTLQELITQKQQLIQQQNPANKLELDSPAFELIAKQNLRLDSIPNKHQKVQLKYVANMNQGATSTDITTAIHPDYKRWVNQISKELQQSIFALDVLTTDYTQTPTNDNAWAIEINGQPYWYHHTFSEGRTHNIAKLILEHVFEL